MSNWEYKDIRLGEDLEADSRAIDSLVLDGWELLRIISTTGFSGHLGSGTSGTYALLRRQSPAA